MQSRIVGTTMPVLEVLLNDPGDALISEAGELSWMTQSIEMTTHTQMGGGGGFFGRHQARRRAAGTIFMTEYQRRGCTRGGRIRHQGPGPHCAARGRAGPRVPRPSARVFSALPPRFRSAVGFQQSLGAGIFGGDGFLLQKISGYGTAWLELSGELILKDLRPGETLRVHPGHVGAFQSSVNFQITRVPGIRNLIFGGDGIFLAALTGPGRVWLQTLPAAPPRPQTCRVHARREPARAGPGRCRWRRNRFYSQRHALMTQVTL